MVGTEMLAPPDTDDWLLLENDVGKLEGGGDDKQLWTAGEPQNHNECLSSSSVLSLSQLNLSALLFFIFLQFKRRKFFATLLRLANLDINKHK